MVKRFFLPFFILMLLVSGCASPSTPDASQNGIVISQARVVLPGGSAMNGMDSTLAGYMSIKNTSSSADHLTGVSVDFGEASLHETKMEGDVMKMSAVPNLAIPAGAIVELRSGSYHIMFMNLTRELKTGDSVTIVLTFEKAGSISVPVKVSDK